MASSSAENSPVPLRVAPPNYSQYPPPLATYENVVASPQLFMETLQKLHAAMRTKFMIPVVGGKALDLHRLFVEVTARGGIEKVLGEKRWKEVTSTFSFPSSATNASFILRKYYNSLLFYYERVYYFKAKYPTPLDVLQQTSHALVPTHASPGYVLPSPETESVAPPPQRVKMSISEATTTPSMGSPVVGVIDGKFESGYLVTVQIGSEDFKGVLYQVPVELQNQNLQVYNAANGATSTGIVRRRRRRKCEIKRRDPDHPKPNRSGYNFFFAEQHARLKPLYPGRDREISRMIGELWNSLKGPEKMIYQEKAVQDKERYRLEMQDYRERLKAGQIMGNLNQLQLPVEHNVDMIDAQSDHPSENGNISWTPDSENNKDTDANIDVYAPSEFELLNRMDMDKELQEDDEAGNKQEELRQNKEKVLFFLDDKSLLPAEEKI